MSETMSESCVEAAITRSQGILEHLGACPFSIIYHCSYQETVVWAVTRATPHTRNTLTDDKGEQNSPNWAAYDRA